MEYGVCAHRLQSLSVVAEDSSLTSSTVVARWKVASGLALMLIDDAIDVEDQDRSEVNPKGLL